MQTIKFDFDKLRDNLDQLKDAESIPPVINTIKQVIKLPNQIIKQNASLVRDRVGDVSSLLSQMPLIMGKIGDSSSLNQLSNAIQTFRQKFYMYIKPTYQQQLKTVVESLRKQSLNSKNQEKKQNQQHKQLLKQPQAPKIKQQDFKKQNLKSLPPSNSIQTAVQPIRKVVKKIPSYVSSIGQVPQSLAILNQYAKHQGYLGAGPVSDLPGKSYIGRVKIQQGGRQLIYPYPMNQLKSGQTPNIMNNFKYYASNAINAWNNFVLADNQFVNYVQKVGTRDGRLKFMKQMYASMNVVTFQAQVLATLNYYYYQIPLQNYLKKYYETYDGKQQSFLGAYQTGVSASRNPFLFDNAAGVQLYSLLISNKQPLRNVYNRCIKFISDTAAKLVYDRTLQFTFYVQSKTNEAISYFQSNGLSKSYYNSLLEAKVPKNIKKKKSILPSFWNNNQIVNLIKIVQKEEKICQDQKFLYQFQFGSQQFYCHDYVWNYNVK